MNGVVDYKGAVIINGESGKYDPHSWRYSVLGNYECCKGSVVLGTAKLQYNELKSQHVFVILNMSSSFHYLFSVAKLMCPSRHILELLGN